MVPLCSLLQPYFLVLEKSKKHMMTRSSIIQKDLSVHSEKKSADNRVEGKGDMQTTIGKRFFYYHESFCIEAIYSNCT